MTEPLRNRSHLDQALLTLGVALVVSELLIVVFGDDPLAVGARRGWTARWRCSARHTRPTGSS